MSPQDPRLPTPIKSPVEEISRGTALSPLDRLPFFGKYKNNLSGLSTSPDSYNESDKQQRESRSSNNDNPRLRNLSVSTVTSRAYQKVDKSLHHDSDSDSDSEAGLAYADSSDDEKDLSKKRVKTPTGILRSDTTSTAASGRVRFQSEVDNGRSAAIAQALGISPTSPSAPKPIIGRQRSDSDSSADTRSIYSRTTSIGPMFAGATFDPTMETVEEEVVIGGSTQEESLASPSRHLRGGSRDQGIGFLTMSTSTQPHRSNTVQVPPHSPENKPPKLPTRAKTTNEQHSGGSNKSSLLEPPSPRKEKRRVRVCLKCERRIEDGRWIKVDTGGALCERCWKNMYLPKVGFLSYFTFRDCSD